VILPLSQGYSRNQRHERAKKVRRKHYRCHALPSFTFVANVAASLHVQMRLHLQMHRKHCRLTSSKCIIPFTGLLAR
jgi:hypothetical protein